MADAGGAIWLVAAALSHLRVPQGSAPAWPLQESMLTCSSASPPGNAPHAHHTPAGGEERALILESKVLSSDIDPFGDRPFTFQGVVSVEGESPLPGLCPSHSAVRSYIQWESALKRRK